MVLKPQILETDPALPLTTCACMHAKSLQSSEVRQLQTVQLFGTLWTRSLPGSLVHQIFQARTPEWVVMFFSRGSS